MIVWSGRGYLIVLVFIGSLFLSLKFLPFENNDYASICAIFTSGIFSLLLGNKWNENNGKVFIDEKTGEKIYLKNRHTLFWIPIQYWSIILFIFGAIIFYQNHNLLGSITSSLLSLCSIIILFYKRMVINKSNAKKLIINKTNVIKKTNMKIDKKPIKKLKNEKIEERHFEPSDHNKFKPK